MRLLIVTAAARQGADVLLLEGAGFSAAVVSAVNRLSA